MTIVLLIVCLVLLIWVIVLTHYLMKAHDKLEHLRAASVRLEEGIESSNGLSRNLLKAISTALTENEQRAKRKA